MGHDAYSTGRNAEATRRFGHELKRSRRQSGLTQRELAERVRYSREMVAAVERGRRYGSRELAVRCDEVLGTGGVLTRLWPMVEKEQFAADRRRGPRPERPRRLGSIPTQRSRQHEQQTHPEARSELRRAALSPSETSRPELTRTGLITVPRQG